MSESAAGCAISGRRHTSWTVDVERGDAPYSHRSPGGDSDRPRILVWVHGSGCRCSVHVTAARDFERQRSSLGDRPGEIDDSAVAIVSTVARRIINDAIQGIGRGCCLGAAGLTVTQATGILANVRRHRQNCEDHGNGANNAKREPNDKKYANVGHADLALVRTVCGLGTRRCARALPLGRSRSPVRTDHGELEIGVKLVQAGCPEPGSGRTPRKQGEGFSSGPGECKFPLSAFEHNSLSAVSKHLLVLLIKHCLLRARHPIVHQLFPRLVECHDLLVNLGDDIRNNISEFARAPRPQSSLPLGRERLGRASRVRRAARSRESPPQEARRAVAPPRRLFSHAARPLRCP